MKHIIVFFLAIISFTLYLNWVNIANADVVITTVPVGTTPGSIGVNPIANKVYVTNRNSSNVTVINGADNSPSTIPVGVTPTRMAINTLTNKIYVINQDSNTVTVIDGSNNTTATVGVGSQPA